VDEYGTPSSFQFNTKIEFERNKERYQFLRGSANAMMDIATMEEGVAGLLDALQQYYMEELGFWTGTEIDAVKFMDDWGIVDAPAPGPGPDP
jgi:aconitate hydratase